MIFCVECTLFVSVGNGPFACKGKGVSLRGNEQTSHLVTLEPQLNILH